MATAEWQGYDRITAMLGRLAHPDPRPVLERWERVIVEDNRAGVLAGLDKDGKPMKPVTYRSGAGKPTRMRGGARFGTAGRNDFRGFGPHASGLNNNLTSAEYRRLTGPPLAPRGAQSRVVTNLKTEHGQNADGTWEATGGWDEVVSEKGVPFLHAHFEGKPAGKAKKRLPKRDLRGVRPAGVEKARRILRDWIRAVIKGQG